MVGGQTFEKLCIGATALGLALIVSGSSFGQDTYTLRMVGAWAPEVSPSAGVGHKFAEFVEELSDGRIEVNYLGASDVVPTFDQPEALVNGVFDVWYGAPNYWAGVVPGGYITELSKFQTPDNGPGSDLFGFMSDMYEKQGVRYLGHAAGEVGVGAHYISSQKKVGGVDDLSGMKVRVPPLTRHFVQAAGAESITLPPSEVFLAVDRGTVDGFTWPVADGYTNYGWQNVTKYLVGQPMYRSGVGLAMNLDKWNELPEDLQAVVFDAVARTQEWSRGWFEEKESEQVDKMKEAGMEVLPIAGPESERWTDLAQESLWDYFATVVAAEEFARAEELLQRNQ